MDFVAIVAALSAVMSLCDDTLMSSGGCADSFQTYASKLVGYNIMEADPPDFYNEDTPSGELLQRYAPSNLALVKVSDILGPFIAIFMQQTDLAMQLMVLSRIIRMVHSFQGRNHSFYKYHPVCDWVPKALAARGSSNFEANLNSYVLWGIQHGFEASHPGQQARLDQLEGRPVFISGTRTNRLKVSLTLGFFDAIQNAVNAVAGPLNDYLEAAMKLDDARVMSLVLPRVDIEKLVADHNAEGYDLGCSWLEHFFEDNYKTSLRALFSDPRMIVCMNRDETRKDTTTGLTSNFAEEMIEMCLRTGNLPMYHFFQEVLGNDRVEKLQPIKYSFSEAGEYCKIGFIRYFLTKMEATQFDLFLCLNEGGHNPGYLYLAKDLLNSGVKFNWEMWCRVVHNGSPEPISFFVQHESIWKPEYESISFDEIIQRVTDSLRPE